MKYIPPRKIERRIKLLESKVTELENYRFRCCKAKVITVSNLIERYTRRIDKLTLRLESLI